MAVTSMLEGVLSHPVGGRGRAGGHDSTLQRVAALVGDKHPAWTKSQLIKIQQQLRRLGLYHHPFIVDGRYGRGTRAGLVEAFGGDAWRTLSAAELLHQLTAASPPKGASGEHRLRYGEMFKDGVLDMTVAIGFDEDRSDSVEVKKIEEALSGRGFSPDPGAARSRQLLVAAGHALPAAAYGHFYVKEKALTYTPPIGDPKQIHAVLRLVHDGTGGRGASAAAAFEEGMVQSDVAYYMGHGRYGTGPDFDPNFAKFELLPGAPALKYDDIKLEDYRVLEKDLAEEGKPYGRGPWGQFQWRLKHHRIKVTEMNLGNVRLTETLKHEEFGAYLINWSLSQKGTGAPLQTGAKGPLAKAAKGHPERQYRVLVFDGCRTSDYVGNIQGTPGFDPKSGGADVLATTRVTYWNDKANALASFLDSILADKSQSVEDIVKGMNAQEASGKEAKTKEGKSIPAFKPYQSSETPVIQ